MDRFIILDASMLDDRPGKPQGDFVVEEAVPYATQASHSRSTLCRPVGARGQSANSTQSSAGGGSGAYSQANRPLQVTTPLGDDVLLITAFSGFESISRLFRFHLTLAAPDQTQVDFNKLMGGSITVTLVQPDRRRHALLQRDLHEPRPGPARQTFTMYEMEVVPTFWRLTQNYQSRIFQYLSVPEILQQVLAPVPYVTFNLGGSFQPREYCVQYRENDHDFACRLRWKKKGSSSSFNHQAGQHEMIVTNSQSFPSVNPSNLILQQVETPVDDAPRVTSWEIQQRVQSGRVTLWDHTFEIPHDHLNSPATIQPSVSIGSVSHQLTAGNNSSL